MKVDNGDYNTDTAGTGWGTALGVSIFLAENISLNLQTGYSERNLDVDHSTAGKYNYNFSETDYGIGFSFYFN